MLSSKFEEALSFVATLHKDQNRKGSNTPFVAHLLSVCALILEDGGTEEEAIAGLLHDAVEDQGGLETLEIIKGIFGENVAHIVLECSECFTIPKPPWNERKEQSIAKMNNVSNSAIRVILADKIHNTQSLIMEYRKHGKDLWNSFKGGREGTIWYYKEVLAVLKERTTSLLVLQLAHSIKEIEEFG